MRIARKRGWAALAALRAAAACVVLMGNAAARAEQFVLVDQVYTHADGSHFSLKRAPGVPASWKTPVDYTGGRVYFRLEVMKKPNQTAVTLYGVCMNTKTPSTCSPQGRFSTTGVVEWSGDIPWGYHVGAYDWTLAPTSIRARATDANNQNLDKGGTFAGAPDLGLYLPLDVRLTVWVVTKGAKLDRGGSAPAPAAAPSPQPRDAAAVPGPPTDAAGGATALAGNDASAAAVGPPAPASDAGVPAATPDPPEGEDPTPARSAAGHGGCRYAAAPGGGGLAGLAVSVLALTARARKRMRPRGRTSSTAAHERAGACCAGAIGVFMDPRLRRSSSPRPTSTNPNTGSRPG